MQKNRDGSRFKEIKHGAETYVMTDNAYTQPPIFNLIQATKYRGIWYAVFSIVAIALINPEYYIYVLPADIAMILGFMYLKYHLLPRVLAGRIKYVAPLNNDNVLVGGFTLSVMRSSFFRLLVFIIYLLYEAYYPNDILTLIDNSNSVILISSVITGFLIFYIANRSLLYPNKFDVKDYHFQVLRYCNNLVKAESVPKTGPVIAEHQIKYYGQPDGSNQPKAPKIHSNKKSIENKSPANRTNRKPDSPATESTEPKDIFANKRVNRQRRGVSNEHN